MALSSVVSDILYRKTAHYNYKCEMYALAHLNLSTASFKCLS